MRNTSLKKIHELAKFDSRVIYIGSDPGAGTLDAMRQDYPDRFIIEGIAEAHIIGMASGMAIEGYVPYVNTIATFLTRRCYEQIAVDMCLHNLPVRLIANGGGLVYAPLGPTHQAIEDIAIMRALPNMSVICPCDAVEASKLMCETLDWPGPIYFRLAKGGDEIVTQDEQTYKIGKAIKIRSTNSPITIITTGIMLQRALKAFNILENDGVSTNILHMPTIKPLDVEAILEASRNSRAIITLEEHVMNGGLGSAVIETISDASLNNKPSVLRIALPDSFIHKYGSQSELLRLNALDADSIASKIKGIAQKRAGP